MTRFRTGVAFALFLPLAFGAQALQMVPAGNIAAQWPFDRVSGTTTPDVSGSNATATLVGAPTLVAGLTGSGLQFNGTNQYLTVPNATAPNVASGSFSIAVWVNPTNTNPGRVINKWDGTTGFLFDVHTGLGGGASAGALRVRLKDGPNDVDRTIPSGVVAGSWQHLALTVDRAGAVAKLYRNGVQQGTDQAITALTGSLTNTALLGIGTIPSSTGNFYNGVMDEPVFYRRVLTLPEIQSLATLPPAAPASLTPTNGQNQVALAWPTVSGASTYNVLRSGTTGGPTSDPYVIIASGLTGLTYTDTTALNPNTYYYVVQAVAGATPGPNSPQATGVPLPVPVTALPNTGLQTNENGTTTSFNITFNVAAPAAGSLVTVTSTNPAEGLVSTTSSPVPSASLTVPVASGFNYYIPITVTGVGDVSIDGNVTYPITVTATNMGVTIPDVLVTNNDTSVAGITFNRTAGLVTSEGGGFDEFTVSLNTRPSAPVTLTMSVSNPAEGTLSQTSVTFNTTAGGPTGWNFPQVVRVTGMDDAVLDFTIPYTIVTSPLSSADGNYSTINPTDVQVANVDNEVIPTLDPVWGGGGSGGCGLTGLELVMLWIMARWRRGSVKITP